MLRPVRALAGLLVWVAVSGCERQPGVLAGRTYYWQIRSSTVEFAQCTDEPRFRAELPAISFNENSYFMYRADAAGKQATMVDCSTFEPSSCVPSTNGVVFDVAGPELVYSGESRAPAGTGGCQLQDATTWNALDEGRTLQLTITHVLSLVDAPAACQTFDDGVKAQSPNGLGLQGCVVTFRVGAEW